LVEVRIRQVRPEFWADETIARMPMAVRLFYIGLWNVADDGGWLSWRVPHIGAVLFPYDPARRRERQIEAWSAVLVEAGRLDLYPCGCACIPTLPKHQRVSGKQSFTAMDAHKQHSPLSGKHSPLSDSPVEERNGKERNVMTVEELAAIRDAEDDVDRQKLVASGRLRH
jgi:hypothetical protein